MTDSSDDSRPRRPSNAHWPIQDGVNRLFDVDDDEIRGVNRLGALSFNHAPTYVQQIRDVLADLSLEDWERLGQELHNHVPNQLRQTIETLDAVLALTADSENAPASKADYEERLRQLAEWFRVEVWPKCIRARVSDAIEHIGAPSLDQSALESLEEIRNDIARMMHERDELARNLEELRPVVDAQREAAASSGLQELNKAYEDSATAHENSWKMWLRWVAFSAVLAAGGGIAALVLIRPETDATNAEIVSAAATELLVIGLLLFFVRLTALQFRVHRHLEAVARNKAAALATFNRIVVGQTEADVRAVVASALAQAVFTSDETGFIDTTSEQITLVERVVGPALQRSP